MQSKPDYKHLWQTTPGVLILNTSRTHNTPWQHKYGNTEIKEEDNRIQLDITKLKVQEYTPILFHFFEKTQKLECKS